MKNRIAEIRARRGMKQADLAAAAGLTTVTISRLETGVRDLGQDQAVALARALGVQPGDLMPIITDGSVPLPSGISHYELSILVTVLSFFWHAHSDQDMPECERLAMAAVKMFQMARAETGRHPFFDLSAVADRLRLDPSNDAG